MKFELISTNSNSEGKFKLEMLAIGSDMQHYASNKLGRQIEIGETISLTTAWPRHKEGLGATSEDYEKYGTVEATGVFKRVA